MAGVVECPSPLADYPLAEPSCNRRPGARSRQEKPAARRWGCSSPWLTSWLLLLLLLAVTGILATLLATLHTNTRQTQVMVVCLLLLSANSPYCMPTLLTVFRLS